MKEQEKLEDILTKEQLRIAEWAAVILQKNWRAYKVRKEVKKSTKSNKSASPERFG